MNNQNENQKGESSKDVFSRGFLRFIKDDIENVMEDLDDLREKLKTDEQLKTWLDIAYDQVEDVLEEIEDREEKVDKLIRNIAS